MQGKVAAKKAPSFWLLFQGMAGKLEIVSFAIVLEETKSSRSGSPFLYFSRLLCWRRKRKRRVWIKWAEVIRKGRIRNNEEEDEEEEGKRHF